MEIVLPGGLPPVSLAPAQIHGDRAVLREEPALAHVYVHRGPRRPARAGRRGPPTAAPWRPFAGRRWPDAGASAPTVFGGVAYASLQHALLACLLWFSGGASGLLAHSTPAAGFPTLTMRVALGAFGAFGAEGAEGVLRPVVGAEEGADGAVADLAVHLVAEEPAHAELEAMRTRLAPGQTALVLVGALRPVRAGHAPPRHQLRGLRLGTDGAPPEHGWYACLSRERASLVFVRHGVDGAGPLAPAVLPPLSGLGLRLWHRGNATFALAARREPDVWEACLRPPPPPQSE